MIILIKNFLITQTGLLLIIFLFRSSPASGQNYPDQIAAQKVDSIVKSIDNFRGALVVYQNGKQIYRFDNTSDSLINIASVNKTITTLGILKLVEMNKLKLSATLGEILADVPDDKKQITIHQMLCHSSGLPQSYAADGTTDPDKALHELLKQKLLFKPGTDFSYSDDAFNVLGIIIEKVTGETYEQFILQEVLKPLKMKQTVFWGEAMENPDIIMGSTLYPLPKKVKTRNYGYIGSGGIFLNLEDLDKLSGFFQSQILPDTMLHLIDNPQYVRSKSYIGYGWFVHFTDGIKQSWNAGNEDWGHGAIIKFIPEDNLKIVAISNSGFIEERHGAKWLSNRIVESLATDFIKTDDHRVTTTHRLKSALEIDTSYHFSGEYNFRESYDGNRFLVSTATFQDEENLVFIHAEEREEENTKIDYPDLPVDTLNNRPCYLRTGCFNLFEETPDDLKNNKYLSHLKEMGFNMNQGLWMVQFIFLNDEHTAEVVLSFAKKMARCPETITETETNQQILYAKQLFVNFRIHSNTKK